MACNICDSILQTREIKLLREFWKFKFQNFKKNVSAIFATANLNICHKVM